MAHRATAQQRPHLELVSEDGVPMGVMWEQEEVDAPEAGGVLVPAEEPPAAQEEDSQGEGGAPGEEAEKQGEAAGRLVPAEEPDGAVTPKRALLQDVNERVKASISAWHTYAMLACQRRWQTIEAFVQDPALYEEIVTEARAEIRRERAQVAKKLDKAKIRKDQPQIDVLTEELEELKKSTPSAMKMDALTLRARGGRLGRQLAVPAAVVVGPVAAVLGPGWWWTLLAYPIAWGWLAAQGHAMAVSDGTVTVSEKTTDKARELAVPEAAQGSAPAAVVGASEAENLILGHLGEWGTRAEGRGLEGVAPGAPTVDALGIRVVLTTSGKLTPEALEKKLRAIRAALSVPRDVRTDLSEGDYGDQAILRIRTRTPDRDTTWRPGRVGVGLDTDTGQPVVLPKGRKLIAGTSGAGKSVLVRVRIAEALTADEPTVVVYVDPKGEESALWRGKVRIATTPREVVDVLRELHRESDDRSEIMQSQTVATWIPTAERPRVLVMVDEGAEVISMDDPEEEIEVIKLIKPLATMGRARAIDVEWTTQKPTVGEGIPSQLIGVMQDRLSLKTAGRKENNLVMGADWSTHELEMGGFAVTNMNGRGPDQAPIQVWDLSDDTAVANVPGGRVWSYSRDPHAPAPAEPDTVEELPKALALALALSEGLGGIKPAVLAEEMGVDVVDVYKYMQAAGVSSGRYRQDGEQERGYPREHLEEAASHYGV